MLSGLLTSVPVQRFLARQAIRFLPSTLRVGRTVVSFGWKDVSGILARDDLFRLGPINRDRIEGVSGPFFLGMDRSPDYFIQRRSGYQAMASVDLEADSRLIQTAAVQALDMADQAIDVVNAYARPIAARTAVRVFGVDGPSEAELMRVARAVFEETFLNLGDDDAVQRRGRDAGVYLMTWTRAEIARRRQSPEKKADFLGALMAEPALSDEDVANILNGYLIGAIDTTATVVANVVYELVSDANLCAAASADAGDLQRMFGWCLEALRRRPHNPLLVREAACETDIGGTRVRAGDRVYAVTFAAHHDPACFPSPDLMDPTRPRSSYLHFGHGPHACAGRDLNALQIPILVAEILKRRPHAVSRMEYEGPFPNKLIAHLRG